MLESLDAGKSVSAFSVMRLLPRPMGRITNGKILLDTKDLLTLTKEEIRKIRGKEIGMIFQEPMNALNPVKKIGEQIAEVFLLHQGCFSSPSIGFGNRDAGRSWYLGSGKSGIGVPPSIIWRYEAKSCYCHGPCL